MTARLLALVAVAAGLAVAPASPPGGADKVDEWFERNAKQGMSVRVGQRFPQPPQYPGVELAAVVFPVRGADTEVTGNLEIAPNSLVQHERYATFRVTHARLWTRAILPVLGVLHHTVVGYDQESGGYISVGRLPEKNAPAGISFRKDSLVLPSPVGPQNASGASISTVSMIKGDAAFVGNVEVWEIELPKGGKPTALIVGVTRVGKSPQMRLREGDYLQLGDVAHEVLAVVPRDRERNILGWIELAGEPVPVAKLAEKKATLVNPKPKE